MNTTKHNFAVPSIRNYIASQSPAARLTKLDIISSLYYQWDVRELKSLGICKAHLLNWEPSYFLSQLTCIAGSITLKDSQGLEYEAHFIGSSLKDLNRAKKIAISFRECNELGLAIALIKIIY